MDQSAERQVRASHPDADQPRPLTIGTCTMSSMQTYPPPVYFDEKRASSIMYEKTDYVDYGNDDTVHLIEKGESWSDKMAPQEDPPNGGCQAWLQVLGAFFLAFNSWGPFLSFGVFQDYYAETYLSSTSLSIISWIGTVQGFLLVIVGTLTGPFFDMGHMVMLLRLGTALIVLGFLVAAESEDYFGVFLSFSILAGVGSGLLFVPSVSIVSQWFTTRRAVATGLAAGGGAFAGVVMPLIFEATIEPLGIRGTFRLFALLSLVTLLVSNYTLQSRSPPGQARAFRNLLEIGLFRNWTFSLFSISLFFSFTGLYIPFYYVPSYAKSQLGISSSVAFYVLVLMNVGALIGRTMPGLLVFRFGSLNLLLFAMLGSGVVHLFWIAVRSLAGLIVFGIIYGILAGAVVALPMTAFLELWPDAKKAGSRFGLSYSFAGVGILLGSPVAGALQAGSGYVALQVFGGIFILIGLGCLVAVKMRGKEEGPGMR